MVVMYRCSKGVSPMKKWADWTLTDRLTLLAILVAVLIGVAQFPPVTEWLKSLVTVECTKPMDLAKFLRLCP